MIHPELIRLEDLVSRLLNSMGSNEDGSGANLVNAAREYAEACNAANARLQICLEILSKGRDKEHQALMAATRQPDLLDACGILSELQSEDYAAFCRRNHLPVAPGLNERAKQEVDPLYARAGSFQKKLRMEFSAANSKRDFREALEICRQLSKVDPTDTASVKQAVALEERLVQEVLIKKIGPALDKGDDEAAVEGLLEIELIAPGRLPRGDESKEKVWIEAITVRNSIEKEEAIRSSANLLIQAEAARDADQLEIVLEILSRLGELMERHEFDLSEERAKLFRDLGLWKDDRLRKARIESDFQRRIEDLKILIRRICDKEFQSTPPSYDENRKDALDLQRVWKEIADFKKPVDGELQERARRLLSDLGGKIERHDTAKRRNLVFGVGLGALVCTVTGVFAMMFFRAGSLAGSIEGSQADQRADDLRRMLVDLDTTAPAWRSFGALPRAESNAQTWLKEQSDLTGRLTGVLSEMQNDIRVRSEAKTWTPVALFSLKSRIDEAKEGLKGVNGDDRTQLDDTLTSIEITWSSIAEVTRASIVEEFHEKLETFDKDVRESMRFDLPLAGAKDRFDTVNAQLGTLENLASAELDVLKPAPGDLARFSALKETFAEVTKEFATVQEILTSLAEASDLTSYSEAIRRFHETSYFKGEQKNALRSLIVAATTEVDVLKQILMPDDPVKWKHLSEKSYAGSGFPKDLKGAEESMILDLRDDEVLSEIYLYSVTEAGKTRRIFSKGGTLKTEEASTGTSRHQQMIGAEVYDPEGSSVNLIEFTSHKYTLERSSTLTRGSLPTGGELSPESSFYNTLKVGSVVNPDFTGFAAPLLGLADKLVEAPEDINPLFRAYIFLQLGRLMSGRPEQWLIDFCDFPKDLSRLQEITGGDLGNSDWCSAKKNESLAKPLSEFFAGRKSAKYLKQAQAVHEYYAQMFTGGLSYCGYLDQNEQVRITQPNITSKELWAFDQSYMIQPLYKRNQERTWEEIDAPAAFSPLFFLRLDPELIWSETAKRNFVEPTDPNLLLFLPVKLGFSPNLE